MLRNVGNFKSKKKMNWFLDKIDEICWEDIWVGFVLCCLITLVCILFRAATADHPVNYYYLDGSCGVYTIKADVNWSEDISINLERAITLDEAIKKVDELNKSLQAIK